MDTISIKAEPRTVLGKHVKQLRRQGLVPANLYGARRASEPLQLTEKLVAQRVARASSATMFSLEVNDGQQLAVVKEVQRHPTSGQVLHVDFYRVAMTEKLKAAVPLHFVGEAPAAKMSGGTLFHNLTSVDVEALPGDLQTSFEVDLSALKTLEDTITVADLKLPGGIEVLTPADEVVAKVLPPRVMEEEVEAAAPVAAPEAATAPAEAEES